MGNVNKGIETIKKEITRMNYIGRLKINKTVTICIRVFFSISIKNIMTLTLLLYNVVV